MDSPISNPKLKRRSNSMFNLHEYKNLIEKDLVQSKQAMIRKNQMARRNYREDLLVKNRNIDLNYIYEESPQINRVAIRDPVIDQLEIKVENMDLDKLELIEPKQEKVELKLPQQQQNPNRITNIKNKIMTLKNNFRSIIGANNSSTAKKKEASEVESRKPPLPKFNNENDVRQPLSVSLLFGPLTLKNY